MIFILSKLLPCFTFRLIRRPGHSEKINSGMILAPLAGIILNLLDASRDMDKGDQNDVVAVFASMDCADTILYGFQYLLEYNWVCINSPLFALVSVCFPELILVWQMYQVGLIKGEDYNDQLSKLEKFSNLLICQTELQATERTIRGGEPEIEDGICCICYTNKADTCFTPCSHRSCYGCISRHLLNCQRCFFCNTTVIEIVRLDLEGHSAAMA